ncbi:unnamed protein product [Plutella xylostella]|uniref:(diamondback moth) hypothetical protein n=1 Tax=Plutella xylostella TaxID=51655 RepID=A0A8S4EBH4_PLUXY|nr:unnamed protein product [Plutella xylostella]
MQNTNPNFTGGGARRRSHKGPGEGVQLKELESLKNLPLSDVKPARKFSVEHPFLFFILDRLDNLVVVAGKVTDPQQPTPFEI